MNYKKNHRTLSGQIVDLVPLSDAHTADVVRLRNAAHVRAFFDEKMATTVQSQTDFLRAYEQKPDDLYWAICRKSGEVIGTTRLQDIDDQTACKGSLAIFEDVAKTGPFTLEAELLLLDYAFGELALQSVWTIVRADNPKMISLNARLSFTKTGPIILRDRLYDRYELARKTYAPDALRQLVSYFARRGSAEAE